MSWLCWILMPLVLVGSLAGAPEAERLDNGLTVLVEEVPGAQDVAVLVLFRMGAAHDPPGRSGRAHLLEHLYCTAAAGETPARDFAAIQARYPKGFNQQTGVDYTVLAGVVPGDQLEAELRDAAARMKNLRIAQADLDREVPRVLTELENMYGGLPHLAGTNLVRQALHPIAQDGRHGGHPDQVKALAREDLTRTWSDYYRCNNAMLVVVGRCEEAATRALIKTHFGPLAPGKAPPPTPARPAARTGTTKRVTVKPILPNATGVVSMGFAAPPPGDPNYPAFLFVISRLYAELARVGFRPGQIPPVYYPPLDDPTTVALQAPVPPDGDPGEVITALERQLGSVLAPKVTRVEKRTALQQLAMLGTMPLPPAIWARNVYGRAFGLARQAQLGLDGAELAKAIDAVTDADLARLGREVFAPELACIAIVDLAPGAQNEEGGPDPAPLRP